MSYQRATWIAGFSTLFANLPLLIYNVYVIIYLQEDLLTAIAIITFITSLRNLLQIFLRIPLGELSQIVGRKPLIISGHLSYIIALFLLYLASDWFLVMIGTLFIGFGMSCFWPSIFGFLGDISIDRVGESNGRIFQLSDIGSILGSILAFFLLQEIQISLKELFGITAAISVITIIISMLLLPESLAKDNRKVVKNVNSYSLCHPGCIDRHDTIYCGADDHFRKVSRDCGGDRGYPGCTSGDRRASGSRGALPDGAVG